MKRLLIYVLSALPLLADCRLPDYAPDAIGLMSPQELIERGHYKRAAEVLTPMNAAHPEDSETSWLLSRAQSSLGDLESALSLAEAAVAADGKNAAYHVQLAVVAGLLAEKAGLLKKLTLAQRAKKALDVAATLDPSNVLAQYGLMMYYYAVPGLIGGDKNKAQQIGEQIAAAHPAVGYFYLGRLALENKDYTKAEAYLRQSVMENPLRYETVTALARFYIEQPHDQARSEVWACQAVHVDPTRGEGWALLARSQGLCDCWTKALEIATIAEKFDAANLAPHYAIAASQVIRSGVTDATPALLRRYLSQPPEGGAPTQVDAHVQLGLVLEKLGSKPEAASEFQTALSLDDSQDAAKAGLKRLKADH